MSKATTTNYSAVYVGRRIGKGGKVYKAFLRNDLPQTSENEMWFAKITGHLGIGQSYRCGADTMPKRPVWDGSVERIDKPEWEAKDEIVQASIDKKRSNAKANSESSPHLKAAITALEPLVDGLGFWEINALVSSLTHRLSKRRTK